jgi:hypothetical protein
MPLYSQIVPQDATILLLSDKVIKIWSKKKKKQILLIKLNDNLSKLGTSALPLYRQHGCDRFWRATIIHNSSWSSRPSSGTEQAGAFRLALMNSSENKH